MTKSKVRWGVLSTANIGTEKVVPAMMRSSLIDMRAIASRDLNRAKSAADSLGIPKTYGDYDELLADPEIEAIYIPLPNHMHVDWTIKAMHANKHVLCEKPLFLDQMDILRLQKECNAHPHLKVMEAFMYRFHPQWIKAKELLDNGEIGELVTVHSFFSYFNDDPQNIRNIAEIGGGGLLDIGCYCVSLSRLVFDSEPIRVLGNLKFDPEMKVDTEASGILEFEKGVATFSCGTRMNPYQRVHIVGKQGRIEIEIPFNAPNDVPCKLFLQKGREPIKTFTFDIVDQYMLQGQAFSKAILNDTDVPTPLTDAIENSKVIHALFESNKDSGWYLME